MLRSHQWIVEEAKENKRIPGWKARETAKLYDTVRSDVDEVNVALYEFSMGDTLQSLVKAVEPMEEQKAVNHRYRIDVGETRPS